jgi:WD40 repeat protein
MDTDSTDVYVWDSATSEVRHLTSGRDQAYIMSWSPDSEWVIHASFDDVTESIGVRALWAVSPASGEVIYLYSVEPYAMDVNILGWLDNYRFLSQAGFFEACAGHVNEISLPSGDTRIILPIRNSGADLDIARSRAARISKS